jgi:hypothetical protein
MDQERALAAADEILATYDVQHYEEYSCGPIGGYAGSWQTATRAELAAIITRHALPPAASEQSTTPRLYSQQIKWTDYNGNHALVGVYDHATPGGARHAAINAARELGWTPPRWWQWWRRKDTRIKLGDYGS